MRPHAPHDSVPQNEVEEPAENIHIQHPPDSIRAITHVEVGLGQRPPKLVTHEERSIVRDEAGGQRKGGTL